MNIANEFVDMLYDFAYSELPEKFYLQARKCLIDYIGVTIAGNAVNRDKIRDFLDSNKGSSCIIGQKEKMELNSAIMVNAYNSHVLELDDGHRVAMMHLAAPVFSGLISVAEKRNCTLADVLRGAVIGYEAAIRLASAIQPGHKKAGFHATGTCGTVGCAMGIAAMLRYDKAEMRNVLSAAATSAAGLLEVITGKSEQKPYNIANAAVAGVNAALFGRYFSGPEDVLGGERGLLSNFCKDYKKSELLGISSDMKICGIYMKPYAACRHCHAPIEAALFVNQNQKLEDEDIGEIIVDTYDLAVYGHDHIIIDGINSAKMSIPYSVAAAVKYHQAGLEMYTQDMIRNESLLRLARKVRVNVSEELSALLPHKRAAVVTIIMKDGRTLQYRTDYPKGEPENQIEMSELYDKFYSLTASAGVEKYRAQEILSFIEKKNNVGIRDLITLINM